MHQIVKRGEKEKWPLSKAKWNLVLMRGEIVVYLVGTDTFVRWMDKSQAIC